MSENANQASTDSGEGQAPVSAAAVGKPATGVLSTADKFGLARAKVEKLLRFLDKNLDIVGDVTVQDEVALSRKALEDARMRLGVAMTYHKGYDPFTDVRGAKRRK